MTIFIHGQDNYGSRKYLEKLLREFRARHGDAISVIDASISQWSDFLRNAGGSDLFHLKKMAVLKNIKSSDWQEELKLFLEAASGGADLILIVYWGEKIDSRGKLAKVLLKSDLVKEFPLPTAEKISLFLREGLREKGKSIDSEALALLASAVGASLWQAESETEKLASLSQAKITVQEVEEIVVTPAQGYIWKFLDAFASGNKKEVLRLLEKEFLAGIEPMQLLYLLIRQVRMLLAWQGKTLSQAALTKLFNLPSFAADRLAYASRKFSSRTLVKILQALGRLDNGLKNNKADHRLLFFLLVDSITK